MSIVTQEFSLNRNQYFSILIQNMLRRRGIVFVFLFLFSALGIKAGVGSALLLFVLLSTLYLLYMLGLCWIKSSPKANPLVFQPCHYEIDHEFISIYVKDGSFCKIKFSHIKKIIKRKGYYLLYFSLYQLTYLPLESIRDPNDLERLKVLLQVKVA